MGFLAAFFATLAVVALAGTLLYILYMSMQDSEFTIIRKRSIPNTTADEVFDHVGDLLKWEKWNSQTALDKNITLHYSLTTNQEGSHCSWDSPIIGRSKIIIAKLSETQNSRRIQCQQQTARSGSSRVSNSTLSIEVFGNTNGNTDIVWNYTGSVPLLLRFLNKVMIKIIAPSIEQSLDNLAFLLGDKTDEYLIAHEGVASINPIRYIALQGKGNSDTLSSEIPNKIQQLNDAIGSLNLTPTGDVFAIWDKVSLASGKTSYHICLGIIDARIADTSIADTSIADTSTTDTRTTDTHEPLPKPFIFGTYHADYATTTHLYGDYTHLTKAWSSAITIARGQDGFSMDSENPPAEFWRTPPTAQGMDVITTIHIPLQGN